MLMPTPLPAKPGARVLLVEDDPLLADGMSAALRATGYSVHCLADGIHALEALAGEHYDLAILDLGLPRMDGIEILERVRALDNDIPVLIVTARDAVANRVGGLRAGADDYLTKPFELVEFEARVDSLARRVRRIAPGGDAGRIALDPALRALRVDSTLVDLTVREYEILEVMLANAGKVLSREQLGARLAVGEEALTDNLFQVHISRLRKKLGHGAVRISTVRGFGYVLQVGPGGA
ncbi:MAG: response regulator transcription factor [Betaproteobacteria bacterium]